MDLTERLDAMEAAIRKPSFRQSSGKANEVNYWIFDYRTDPVILALPEELFMILSVMIIILLFITCAIIKVAYYKAKRMK